jgi:hypothetical protein
MRIAQHGYGWLIVVDLSDNIGAVPDTEPRTMVYSTIWQPKTTLWHPRVIYAAPIDSSRVVCREAGAA